MYPNRSVFHGLCSLKGKTKVLDSTQINQARPSYGVLKYVYGIVQVV